MTNKKRKQKNASVFIFFKIYKLESILKHREKTAFCALSSSLILNKPIFYIPHQSFYFIQHQKKVQISTQG